MRRRVALAATAFAVAAAVAACSSTVAGNGTAGGSTPGGPTPGGSTPGGSTPGGGGAAIGAFEARPLVMPAQPVTGARPNPFAGIRFDMPADEGDYDALTAGQQQQLKAALSGVDCAMPPDLTSTTGRVVCDGTGAIAALVGPAIVRAGDVASATAVPARPTWTVLVTFTASGAATWQAYTAAHHTSGNQVADLTSCGAGSVPCADFTAFIVGNDAVSIPVSLATTGGKVQISGNFNKASATALARRISP